MQDLVYKLVPGVFGKEMKRRRDFYAAHPEPGRFVWDELSAELLHNITLCLVLLPASANQCYNHVCSLIFSLWEYMCLDSFVIQTKWRWHWYVISIFKKLIFHILVQKRMQSLICKRWWQCLLWLRSNINRLMPDQYSNTDQVLAACADSILMLRDKKTHWWPAQIILYVHFLKTIHGTYT